MTSPSATLSAGGARVAVWAAGAADGYLSIDHRRARIISSLFGAIASTPAGRTLSGGVFGGTVIGGVIAGLRPPNIPPISGVLGGIVYAQLCAVALIFVIRLVKQV